MAGSRRQVTYVAGYEGTVSGRAAVGLAQALARTADARVVAATVCTPGGLAPSAAHALLDAVETTLEVDRHVVEAESVCAGLEAAARDEHAALIVVGPHRGPSGMLTGSTARSLFEDSPFPVGVAPSLSPAPAYGFRHVAVGYDGSEESEMALGAAAVLAASMSADVRVIAVADLGADVVSAVVEAGLDELLRHAQTAVAALDVPATTELVEGPAAPALVRAAVGADVLVVGSRSRGPLETVESGSVAGYAVEHAPCPVLVVPRSVALSASSPH